jgi:hypothetical protein
VRNSAGRCEISFSLGKIFKAILFHVFSQVSIELITRLGGGMDGEWVGGKSFYTDKKKIKFSSYIGKFRMEQLQSHK